MKSGAFLGVWCSPTKLRLGLLHGDGHVARYREAAMQGRTAQAVVLEMEAAISQYLQDCPLVPDGIGIGLPGYINPGKGIWMHCMSMGVRTPVMLASAIRDRFALPVFIDNDLNAATLAENYFGIGRFCKDFLYVQADEGVAIGIVSGGRLIRGAANCAGELGHVSVETDGEPCACNSHGCLENIVASEKLSGEVERLLALYPKSTLHLPGERMTSDMLFTHAQQGDELALRVARRAVRALGMGIVDCLNLLNPEHIVLSGSTCQTAWFVEQIKKYVYDNGFVSSIATLKDISHSNVGGDYTEVLSAACLCFVPEVQSLP